jgi:hypothetical protein
VTSHTNIPVQGASPIHTSIDHTPSSATNASLPDRYSLSYDPFIIIHQAKCAGQSSVRNLVPSLLLCYATMAVSTDAIDSYLVVSLKSCVLFTHLQPPPTHMETAVTRLLVSTRQLLESLTMWSNGQTTDQEVSGWGAACFNLGP